MHIFRLFLRSRVLALSGINYIQLYYLNDNEDSENTLCDG